ncbi:hypothetical protein HGA34_04805 [Candidatus Falkowbacteria bacterium]|nr:hypothetical protein [Candidatus Falkowbacteria bacterium]
MPDFAKYLLIIALVAFAAAAIYFLLIGMKLSACIDKVDGSGKCQTIVCRGWAYVGRDGLSCFGKIKSINDSGQK